MKTIKTIDIEYDDGTRLTMTPQLFVEEFVRFMGGVHTEPGAVHDPKWKRCESCNATGRVGLEYCHCRMGHDLAIVEGRDYFENTLGGMDGSPAEDSVPDENLRVEHVIGLLRKSSLGVIPDTELRKLAWRIIAA